MRRNVVLLMACWLTAVAAAIPPDSGAGRLQHQQEQQDQYWDGAKPGRYQHDGLLRSHVLRGGGNKHFVTSIFPEMDARGFHEYVFDGLQPDFQWPSVKFKRNYYPQGITSRGFSDDIFHQSFGMFEPLKRSVSRTSPSVANLLRRPAQPHKRRPEMDANGFHGESFTGGFDRFDTMKRRPEMDATGFEGDSFTGFGRFETMKRARDDGGDGYGDGDYGGKSNV